MHGYTLGLLHGEEDTKFVCESQRICNEGSRRK
jgi:hypothetical protein